MKYKIRLTILNTFAYLIYLLTGSTAYATSLRKDYDFKDSKVFKINDDIGSVIGCIYRIYPMGVPFDGPFTLPIDKRLSVEKEQNEPYVFTKKIFNYNEEDIRPLVFAYQKYFREGQYTFTKVLKIPPMIYCPRVPITEVPEPMSLSLLSMGLLGGVITRYKR